METAAPHISGRLHELPLRDYQQDCLDTILHKYESGTNRQLISMATGSGKTVVFSHLIRRYERPTLILAHTNELLEQARDKIDMVCPGLEVGICNGFKKELDAHVVIASIQSARQAETLRQLIARNFELLIIDECHHAAADSFRTTVKSLGFGPGTEKLLVGFSATAFRTDSRGLGEDFDEIVFEKSVGSLIEEGYLSPPRGIKVATDLNLRKVAADREDYTAKGLEPIMNTPELRAMAVEAWQQHAADRPTIVFGCSVQHAQSLADDFTAIGVKAAMIHGGTERAERARILSDYQSGKIQVITNCQILTEGYDAPATSAIVVARPTKSKGLYQQMAGRALRKFPGKNDAIIIDFNDAAHTLCNASILMPDAEALQQQEKERKAREKALIAEMPAGLNKKLKKAYVTSNLLGDSFNWVRDEDEFNLRGNNGFELRIIGSGDSYKVVTSTIYSAKVYAAGLTFDYAFSVAEDYAREHRELFILTDRSAPWRDLEITEKQQAIFRRKGFKKGIPDLTRGQASDLIPHLRRAS